MCTGHTDTELVAACVPAQDPLPPMARAVLLLLSSPQHPGDEKSGEGRRTHAPTLREMLPALEQTHTCPGERRDRSPSCFASKIYLTDVRNQRHKH